MSSTAQVSPAGCTSFLHLPSELRNEIYILMDPPRLVELCYDYDTTMFWTTAKVPITLQISKESRKEAKRRYKLAFAGLNHPASIWFDFSRDTLLFGKFSLEEADIISLSGAAGFFETSEGLDVKHLAISSRLMEKVFDVLINDIELFDGAHYGKDRNIAHLLVMAEFYNLETLSIIGPDHTFNHFMYQLMCKHAQLEDPDWSMPVLGYIVEEDEDEERLEPVQDGDREEAIKELSLIIEKAQRQDN